MIEIPEIPGYRIEKILGQGGMSTVYLGFQENLKREVAIKILAPEMFQDEQYLKRFLNEARTASHLSHPNIVTIHDVGQVEDHCYIVMERLHESLVERVKFHPGSRLNPVEAFKIIRQIAGALAYAHKEGVIHRDLKPDNILFRKDGTPVLVDFGIARALDSQAQLTNTGMIIGTPHYMSPEQCRGEKIDGQSDLYSLGIMLYEILTGDVPYRADSAAGVLLKHVQSPIPQLPPEFSKYQPVLTRMMAKEKRERVHSGTELIRLLDSFSPDSRVETIKGLKPDVWVFDDSTAKKQHSPAPRARKESDILTLQSPLPDHDFHPYQDRKSSKGPVLVFFFSLPFILAGIYLLFFQNQFTSNTFTSTSSSNSSTTANNTGTANTTPPTETVPPGEPPRPQKETETVPTGGNRDVAPKGNEIDDNYNRFITSAGEFLKSEHFKKALDSVKKARDLKDTDEAKTLEENIKDRQAEFLFTRHFNRARDAFKKKNYRKAKANIQQAKKYKTTGELDKLAADIREIERKRAKEAERARIAAARKKRLEKKDDDAYNRAVAANSIYSYEKYMEIYPKGRHYEEAKKRYDERKDTILFEDKIKDDTVFAEAEKTGTISAFEDYLQKYPRGLHISGARTKIGQLKQKILRETKVKLSIRHIRFFESGPNAPALGRRTHATQFSSRTSRYIYTEIAYDNNLYRVGESSNQVTIVYTSGFTQELKGTIRQDQSARNGIYTRGMGWTEPGKWPPGTYTVTIYLDGQKAGQSRFEIY